MENFLDPAFWLRWLGIVIIDLALAGDNALVIALAVRTLPAREQFWGRVWGTLGAVALRLVFIIFVAKVLDFPLLRLIGGILLLWIALKLVREKPGDSENIRHGATLLHAVWIIILADVIMSLDNVLAIAGAAHGDTLLVVFGILFSLPLVVWGSGLLTKLMSRFHWIVWIGGGVIGYVAGDMILKDDFAQRWLGALFARLPWLAHALPIALGILFIALGWFFEKRNTHKS